MFELILRNDYERPTLMPIFTDRCTENANFATILIQKTERKCGRKRREVRDLRRQRG